ncbi:NUDIX hydrolase [Corynebacterium sp. 335C]
MSDSERDESTAGPRRRRRPRSRRRGRGGRDQGAQGGGQGDNRRNRAAGDAGNGGNGGSNGGGSGSGNGSGPGNGRGGNGSGPGNGRGGRSGSGGGRRGSGRRRSGRGSGNGSNGGSSSGNGNGSANGSRVSGNRGGGNGPDSGSGDGRQNRRRRGGRGRGRQGRRPSSSAGGNGRGGDGRRSPARGRGQGHDQMRTSLETSAGGLVVSGLAEAVRDDGSVDLNRIHVALIGRLDRRGRLLWSMPKGHVEPGEDHAATAEREVWEETGVHGAVVAELGTIDYWFVLDGRRIHKTVHHHLLRYVDGDLNDEDPEVTEVQWVPAEGLVERLAYADERKLARRAHDMLPDVARAERDAGRGTPR